MENDTMSLVLFEQVSNSLATRAKIQEIKFGKNCFSRKFLPLTLYMPMSNISDMTTWSLRTAGTPDTVKIMRKF